MATTSNFRRKNARLAGTTAAQVGAYTVGPGLSAVVKTIRICARYKGGNFTVSGWYQDAAGNKTYFCDTYTMKPGQIYLPLGGDGLDVMEEGDSVYIQCSVDNAVDVVMSLLEDQA